MRHHVVGVQAEQQVGIDGVVTDLVALVFIQAGQVIAAALAVQAHGFGVPAEAHGATNVSRLWRFVVRAHVIGQPVQCRMQHGTMQALVVVQDDQLPVRFDVVHDTLIKAQVLHLPRGELLRKIGQLRFQRFRLRRQVDKDVAIPNSSVHAVQRVVLATEAGALVHVRRSHQPAIQAIRPPVITALDSAGERPFSSRDQPRTTMPANVIEGAHRAALVADDDDAFSRDLAQEVVARLRNLIGTARAHPCLTVEAFHLLAENFGIGVVPCGKRLCDRCYLCAHGRLRSKSLLARIMT